MKKWALCICLFVYCTIGKYTLLLGQTQYENNISDIYIQSAHLNQKRKVTISLPPNYDSARQKYPVIVLLDAHVKPLFDYNLSVIRYRSLYDNLLPNTIIVGVHQIDRGAELRPLQENSISHKFLSFLHDELMQHIQANYRAADYKIIAGHSNAAEFITFLFLKKPEAFNGYIAVSPSVTNEKTDYYFKSFDTLLNTISVRKRSFIFSVGGDKNDQFENSLRIFSVNLKEYLQNRAKDKFGWKFIDVQEKNHDQTPMFTIPDALPLLFNIDGKHISRAVGDSIYNLKTDPVLAIQMLCHKISSILGYEAMPDVNWLNSFGYRYLGDKRIKDAIQIFRQAIEWYPEDSNLYDSMAEAFETNKEFDKAIEYVKTAIKKFSTYQVTDLTRQLRIKQAFEEHLKSLEEKKGNDK